MCSDDGGGGGPHGDRGMTAATMVGVACIERTLPRHMTRPAYLSVLYVFLDVSSRAAIYPMGMGGRIRMAYL